MKLSIVLGLAAALATVSHAQQLASESPVERYVAVRPPSSSEESVSERGQLAPIVGTVACTPYKTGTLQAKTKDGELAYARFSSHAHGVDGKTPILLTQIHGKALRPQTFTFSTCNGTFMSTTPSKGAFEGSPDAQFTYGHLSPAKSVGKNCASAYEHGTINKPQYLVKSDCSESDNGSQLYQWWELVEVPGKDGKTTLVCSVLSPSSSATP
ncbi:hypothetical protein CF319_g8155 [Tilletia indica]|nr:hypothetical protein CF319_g8155 [Tilletia indica]